MNKTGAGTSGEIKPFCGEIIGADTRLVLHEIESFTQLWPISMLNECRTTPKKELEMARKL